MAGYDGAIRQLVAELPRLRTDALPDRVAALRRLALAEGLAPAAELADGLAAALRRSPGEVPLGCWIEALGSAGRYGAEMATAPLLLATIGARLNG